MRKLRLSIIVVMPTLLTIAGLFWTQDDALAQQQYDLDTFSQLLLENSKARPFPAGAEAGQAFVIINTTYDHQTFDAVWSGSIVDGSGVNSSYEGSEPVAIPFQCSDGQKYSLDFDLGNQKPAITELWVVDHSGTIGYNPTIEKNQSTALQGICGRPLTLKTFQLATGEEDPPKPKAGEAMIEISAEYIYEDGTSSPRAWSGSVRDGEFDTISYDGSGKDAILISCADGTTYSVSIQNQRSDGVLNVTIFDDVGILDEGKTDAKYGIVSLSGVC